MQCQCYSMVAPMDSNETSGKKSWSKLYKNFVSCFDEILEEAPCKVTVVRSLNIHLTNPQNKTSLSWPTLVLKWMDSYTRTYQWWTSNKNLIWMCANIKCRLYDLLRSVSDKLLFDCLSFMASKPLYVI